ncbi:MAG: molecular chaperone HtpG, partial [Holdemanella sp.]|nr:molecular chaperone HtpG [Holdemanella sp.]
KEEQKEIYYVSGKDVELIDKLPIVQTLKKKEYEVLYLTDDVDEFVMSVLHEYREKTFKNATQGELDLNTEEEKEALEKTKTDNKDLLDFMKESLDGKVIEVKVSNRLIDDPVCLSAGEGVSFEMERVFANMPKDNMMMDMKATRILEINPDHPIFTTLQNLYEKDNEKVKEIAEVLYDQALLIEGFAIEDPIAYSRKICELLVK